MFFEAELPASPTRDRSDSNIASGGSTDDETALLAAADELFDGLSIGESTWDLLRAGFTTQQILDVIVTVGVYVTLAMVIGATGVPIEP